MLEARALRHVYGGRTVLSIDALTLAPGARLALVGPNGAGKSTLLRVLGFLELPAAGSLTLDGHAVVTDAERRAARRAVTLVEQRPFLFRGTVRENVAWGLWVRGVAEAEATRRASAALERIESGSLASRDARAISEGERQRVAVARALAVDPSVLLLDEPVSGADSAARQALTAALAAAQAERPLAICLASHLLEDAYRWADAILALHDGVPVPVTPENLFRVDLPGGGPMQQVRLGALAIDVVSDRAGPATLAIPPEEIVLSSAPLRSSARNTVQGRIVRVSEQGAAMRVTISAGVELVALVTRRSFEELGLAVGGPVVASFKSVAVRIF